MPLAGCLCLLIGAMIASILWAPWLIHRGISSAEPEAIAPPSLPPSPSITVPSSSTTPNLLRQPNPTSNRGSSIKEQRHPPPLKPTSPTPRVPSHPPFTPETPISEVFVDLKKSDGSWHPKSAATFITQTHAISGGWYNDKKVEARIRFNRADAEPLYTLNVIDLQFVTSNLQVFQIDGKEAEALRFNIQPVYVDCPDYKSFERGNATIAELKSAPSEDAMYYYEGSVEKLPLINGQYLLQLHIKPSREDYMGKIPAGKALMSTQKVLLGMLALDIHISTNMTFGYIEAKMFTDKNISLEKNVELSQTTTNEPSGQL